jgi:predicted MFS family arabinose efflux permease
MSSYVEFRFGWPVVLSSALGIALGMSPLPFYTIGVFAGPFMQEFGWSIAQVMSALAVFTMVALVAAPLVGYITDRIGVRKVVLTSILFFSLTMMSFGLNNGSMTLYLSLWALLAFAGAGTLPITFTRAISRWFHAKRGLALGIALIGTGIAGALAKMYAGFLIQEFGWRMAYVGVGALPLVIAFPAALLFFRDVDDPKAGRRAQQLIQHHADSGGAIIFGMSLGQSLKDWRFWLLAITFVPLSFAIGGPIPNLETLLQSKGFEVGDSIFLASLIGYSVLVGRLVGGFLLDHFWAPAVACALLMLPAISMFLLQGSDATHSSTTLAIVLLGFAAGIEFDLLAFLVSKYFGIRHYAVIYGTLYAFFAAGAGFGPAIYGRVFQASGSYDSILNVSMWIFIVCSLALLALGRYRDAQLLELVEEQVNPGPTG